MTIPRFVLLCRAPFDFRWFPYAGRMVQPEVHMHSIIERAGFGPGTLTIIVLSDGIACGCELICESASFARRWLSPVP